MYPSRTPESQREYYLKNRDKKLNWNSRWKHENPSKFLYNSCRQRAKKESLEFNITPDEIKIPDLCPYLNVPMQFGDRYAPSVDRIDNTKGYITGNIQVISTLANRMKNCATEEELLSFARRVLNGQDGKKAD